MIARTEDLDTLKARVDLVDLVARHVDLKRRGSGQWGRCPLHGEKTASFKVDPGKQRFICFGCGAKGDAIDFLVAIEGLGTGEAIKRLREIVGDERADRPRRRPRKTVAADNGFPPDPEAERRRELAQEIWRQATSLYPGYELPWRYLIERRRIPRWDHDRLRWHPACPWGSGTTGCIIAPVNDHQTGLVTAIWRIKPCLDGPVERRGLGPTKGNAARLFEAPGPELVVAEGVEDALAAHALFGAPAWAALHASNMAVLILPPRIRDVLVLADRDEPKEDGRQVGLEAAHALARRLRAEGRGAEVRWTRPGLKDANDVMRGDGSMTDDQGFTFNEHPDFEPAPEPPRSKGKARPNGDGTPPLPYFRGEDYRQAPQRDMLVKGLLASGDLSVFYGPPKSGKSFLVTDLALAVAEAVATWFGHRIKRQGFVLYLVMEGAGGFPNRLRAWSDARGRPVPDSFIWVPVRLNFLARSTSEAAADDVQRIKALVEHLKQETGLPCVLIVVDTAARVMAGADENSSQHMGLFLDQCAILQELPDRPNVLVVHHENAAGSRTRGSTALDGGGGIFVRVEKTADGRRAWFIERAKDDPEGERHGFTLHRTSLGLDEDGDEITSCVVAEAEAPPRGEKANPANSRPRGKNQRLVLKALAAAICDAPDPPPPERDIPPNVSGVWRGKWEAAALRLLPLPTEKGRQEAFKDAVGPLVENGFCRHVNGYFWLPMRDGQIVAGIGGDWRELDESA